MNWVKEKRKFRILKDKNEKQQQQPLLTLWWSTPKLKQFIDAFSFSSGRNSHSSNSNVCPVLVNHNNDDTKNNE